MVLQVQSQTRVQTCEGRPYCIGIPKLQVSCLCPSLRRVGICKYLFLHIRPGDCLQNKACCCQAARAGFMITVTRQYPGSVPEHNRADHWPIFQFAVINTPSLSSLYCYSSAVRPLEIPTNRLINSGALTKKCWAVSPRPPPSLFFIGHLNIFGVFVENIAVVIPACFRIHSWGEQTHNWDEFTLSPGDLVIVHLIEAQPVFKWFYIFPFCAVVFHVLSITVVLMQVLNFSEHKAANLNVLIGEGGMPVPAVYR